ncbi:uncharacterized protein MELLADRAFT_106602 [Melampsora larici-populina 98AG31]|uniref:Rho-GAP domain-containing protein n=1 Tax=Melampsora larici-populina (strain 98AG31 / pathotype 3-4-7) TaxID=747676 RepID=F4RM16_MELLP|nr:uncharacterized protein MELLADRAFT_106602 [Melampsora larici-populina 98AG31]EGG06644.1 hypothetical protein MELLADRAFT_106602 [Melampsora larici-populina 98AG31]
MNFAPPPRLSSRGNHDNNNHQHTTSATSLPIRQRAQSAQSHDPSILNLKPFNQSTPRSRPSFTTQPNSSTSTLNRSALPSPSNRFTSARLNSQSFKLNDEPHQLSTSTSSSPNRQRTQTLTSIPIPKQTFRSNTAITPQRSRTRLTPSRSTSTSPLPPRNVRSPNPTITSDEEPDIPLRKSLRTNPNQSSVIKKSSNKSNPITNTNVKSKSKSTTYLPQSNTEPIRLQSFDLNPLNVEKSNHTESTFSSLEKPLRSNSTNLSCKSIPEVINLVTNRESILKNSINSVNELPNHFDLPIDDERKRALQHIMTSLGHESFISLIDQFKLHELLSQRELYHTQQQIQSRLAFIQPDLFSPQPELFRSQNFDSSEHPTSESKLHTTSSHSNSSAPIHYPTSNNKRSGSSSTPGNNFLEKFRTKLNSKNLLGNKTRNKKLSGTISSQLFSPTSSFNRISSSEKISISVSRSSVTQEKHKSQILGAQLESMNKSTCVITIGSSLHVLPTLPFMVIEEIYRRGMHTIGILRITGDFNRIDSLMQLFQTCTQPDLSQEDIHTLAGTLKQFLRALPDPIFHPIFFEALCTSCQSTNDETQSKSIELVSNLLKLLPTRSLSLLIYLISFLSKIPQFPENRIQFDSISLIFGPTIFLSRQIGLPGLGLNSYSASLGEGLLIETKKSRDCLFWLLGRWDEILKCLVSNEGLDQKLEFVQKKVELSLSDDSLIYSSGDENPTQTPKDEDVHQSSKPFTWINLNEVEKSQSIKTNRTSNSTVEFTTSTIHQEIQDSSPEDDQGFDDRCKVNKEKEEKVKIKRNSSLDSNDEFEPEEVNLKVNPQDSTINQTTTRSSIGSEKNLTLNPTLPLDLNKSSMKIKLELKLALERIKELENQLSESNEIKEDEIKKRLQIEVEFDRVLMESNGLKDKLKSIQLVLDS